ncbi:alpha/beta hydrolase [Micromonospora sp. WMMD710]|uniref:alpha/beta fold hydrolase n=1 Tax=Micromonospora sp. WMMD710 TaxID=3016085 RepID=UPI002417F44F|nr:alpha/beta hydrolase [Micromonospora sp. WMMD710]MDG4759125.1 alpha/beta hydrolase [Micromonospora sp. WMMD710]
MSRTPEGRHTVRAGEVSLVCHIRGHGPLCVVHPGGPGMHWEYLRMPLVERDHTVIYLEPAGTGGSSGLSGDHRYDIATYVEHLDAVAGFFAEGPIVVLGHGHGGFVAQSYALRRPDKTAGLILYATAPAALARRTLGSFAVESALRQDMPSATQRLREIVPAHFAHYSRREVEFVGMRGMLRCWPRPAVEFDEVFDVRDELHLITVPTMVIAGAHDVSFGPECAAILQAGIPDAGLRVFENSGHFAHLEEAERFAHVVREFTRRASTPRSTPPSEAPETRNPHDHPESAGLPVRPLCW